MLLMQVIIIQLTQKVKLVERGPKQRNNVCGQVRGYGLQTLAFLFLSETLEDESVLGLRRHNTFEHLLYSVRHLLEHRHITSVGSFFKQQESL